MKEIVIKKAEENQRIDKYMQKLLVNTTKSFIYKMFRKKNITLNGKKINGNEIINFGDVIRVYFSDETFGKFVKVNKEKDRDDNSAFLDNIPLNIIYEDDELIVCNKPVGILSQSDGKNISMVDLITAYYQKNHQQSTFKPGICNRLDRNTSGIILSGKSVRSLQALNLAIKKKETKKIYHTIVKGSVNKAMALENSLIKDRQRNKVTIQDTNIGNNEAGNYIKTYIEPIKWNKDYSLLRVQIFTGKTHQIRAHLASIGHPIIGDNKYGDRQLNQRLLKEHKLAYQLLHAYSYDILGREYIAPYPKEFIKIVDSIFGIGVIL